MGFKYCINANPSCVATIFTWHGHVAVSSQGMQDRLGAKSANWLASRLCCQPRFQFQSQSCEDERREL